MMFAILRSYGIPEKIVKCIRLLYDSSSSRVYVNGQTSEKFDITTGVLQGDVLAPFLFIIVIDYLTKNAIGDYGFTTHQGTTTNTRSLRNTADREKRNKKRVISDLDFADDIALLEGCEAKSQEQLSALSTIAATVGLEINAKKTKRI